MCEGGQVYSSTHRAIGRINREVGVAARIQPRDHRRRVTFARAIDDTLQVAESRGALLERLDVRTHRLDTSLVSPIIGTLQRGAPVVIPTDNRGARRQEAAYAFIVAVARGDHERVQPVAVLRMHVRAA